MHISSSPLPSMKNETTYQAVLGRLIARKRQERRMDQSELARCVGVNRSTWSRIEAGSSALSMDQLAKAAGALGVSLGDLMLEVDDIVRELRNHDVEVHQSRDQAKSASVKTGGATAVAFLSGAVLGGIIAAMLADRSAGSKRGKEGPS